MATKKLKNDRYRRVRGGYSRMLKITCTKCNSPICSYQKDGPGNLRRMYIDRMENVAVSTNVKTLTCANAHVLGVKTIFEKENRSAFRLFVDSVSKKIIKS